MYNVLETIDSPPAPACPLCGPGPPAPLPSRILSAPLFVAAPAARHAIRTPPAINRALQPSPPPIARASQTTSTAGATSTLSAGPSLPTTVVVTSNPSALTATVLLTAQTAAAPPVPVPLHAPPPATGTTNTATAVPANAAVPAHNPHCTCTAPKLGSVIDHNLIRTDDILQYSNGAQIVYVRKQGADAYIFNRMTGEQLGTTHQGPKSMATALIKNTGRKVKKNTWGEFEVIHGKQHLGTLFDVRHAAFCAGLL